MKGPPVNTGTMPAHRKPTQLKIVSGTAQPCRMNPSEPQPPRAVPAPPKHLSTLARKHWPYICAVLDTMNILTASDALAVEGFAECYAELLTARAEVEKHGTHYEGPNGMIRAHPAVAQAADADRRFLAYLARFGLTPADRSRVSARAEAEKSPFADF